MFSILSITLVYIREIQTFSSHGSLIISRFEDSQIHNDKKMVVGIIGIIIVY